MTIIRKVRGISYSCNIQDKWVLTEVVSWHLLQKDQIVDPKDDIEMSEKVQRQSKR